MNERTSQFNDCRSLYNGVCEEFKEATDHFKKFYLRYSIESEYFISNIEKIDHDHEENLKAILFGLIKTMKEISEINKKSRNEY